MKIKETEIEGLYLFDCLDFPDSRGSLLKPFSVSFFKDMNSALNVSFKEPWFTKSHKDVIRAMHFQVGPKACAKLVSVIQGAVLDVVIDLRADSKSFSKVFSIELNSNQPQAIYIPIGCAHGYKVLENNTITLYMATDTHDADNDVGILWNSIDFDWAIGNPVLSDRDMKLPPLDLNSFRK